MAEGWLGRFLRFSGWIKDPRAPVMVSELVEMQALYQVEADEEEERQRERELTLG